MSPMPASSSHLTVSNPSQVASTWWENINQSRLQILSACHPLNKNGLAPVQASFHVKTLCDQCLNAVMSKGIIRISNSSTRTSILWVNSIIYKYLNIYIYYLSIIQNQNLLQNQTAGLQKRGHARFN
jgi:hypothetical protein